MVRVAAILLIAAAVQGAGPSNPTSTSASSRSGVTGASGSFAPQLSKNGRYLLFQSTANNLVTNDDHSPWMDVFVRDLSNDTVTLVSVNSSGIGGGNADALFPAISSNGQFVVFASSADNLVVGDTNQSSDVFIRDLIRGTTSLLSSTTQGRFPTHPFPRQNLLLSSHPLISDNGRWVFYESVATNLTELTDTNAATDIFAHDLSTGEKILVTVNASGTAAANAGSELSSISADGRFVAFTSTATDLVLESTNLVQQVYVRDMQQGITRWASRNVRGGVSPSAFYPPICLGVVLSDDGSFAWIKVAYSAIPEGLWQVELQTLASQLVGPNNYGDTPSVSSGGQRAAYTQYGEYVRVWDRLLQTNYNIASGYQPSISADGNVVAYHRPGDGSVWAVRLDMLPSRLPAPQLVSIRTNGQPAGAWSTGPLAVSADGAQIGFVSPEATLVENDFNAATDVFLGHLPSQVVQLISRRSDRLPSESIVGDSAIRDGCMSSDGRFVVFSATDQPAVAGDTNGTRDIYLTDLLTRTLTPVSATSNLVFRSNSIAYSQTISANGRFVCYARRSPAQPTFSPADQYVYRRDLVTFENALVSIRPPPLLNAATFPNGPSGKPVLSSDGNLVAFQSSATDLITNTFADSRNRVFLRDMAAETCRWLGGPVAPPGGTNQFAEELQPLFTPDDRWVIFAARKAPRDRNGTEYFAFDRLQERLRAVIATPLRDDATGAVASANSRFLAFYTPRQLTGFRHDLLSDAENLVICTNCLRPSLSGDGRLVAFESHPPDSPYLQIYARDLPDGEPLLISAGRDGSPGNGDSRRPLVSADGRFIVFVSMADDLVLRDQPGTSDVFVRDRLLGVTYAASLAVNGATGNRPSLQPVLGPDGRTVVFASFADDLVGADFNFARDVFVVRLGGVDSDQDGLDDDWEIAYFDNLARDGDGDYDGDGQTDRAEFLAGTNPSNATSLLRVISLTMFNGETVTVFWSAVPGQSYQLEYKSTVEETQWRPLGSRVTADDAIAWQRDIAEPSERRFYRVRRL